MSNCIFGRLPVRGFLRALHQSSAAGFLDCFEPEGPVFEQPGEDDANGVSAGMAGQRTKQRIDIVAAVNKMNAKVRADGKMPFWAAYKASAFPEHVTLFG